MKVLFDSQAFDMQTHGGVSRCFAELIHNMPAEVETILPLVESQNIYLRNYGLVSDHDTYQDFCQGRPNSLKRFIFKLIYNTRNGHLKDWDRMPRFNIFKAEELLKQGNFDVFHPTFFDPYFLRHIGNKPFVLTVHDMITELYPQYFHNPTRQQHEKKLLIDKAAHIIAVSQRTKSDLMSIYSVPDQKITVIYHGADETPYVPGNFGTSLGSYVLYVGDRKAHKNFLPLVREMKTILTRHPQLSLVCTGKPFTSAEEQEFHRLGIADRIHHVFPSTDSDLLDLYHNALTFVYPSEYEGFGIPILEAYKADCPVMLNHASCFPEIAQEAAVYFKMNDTESTFIQEFEKLYNWTPQERQSHLFKQRMRLKHFNWRQSARKLASVYALF